MTRRWLFLLVTFAAFLFILGRRKSLGMFFARPERREMPEDFSGHPIRPMIPARIR
jgi:hypothetical protein